MIDERLSGVNMRVFGVGDCIGTPIDSFYILYLAHGNRYYCRKFIEPFFVCVSQ